MSNQYHRELTIVKVAEPEDDVVARDSPPLRKADLVHRRRPIIVTVADLKYEKIQYSTLHKYRIYSYRNTVTKRSQRDLS